MFKKMCFGAIAVLAIAGCQATTNGSQAEMVRLSPNPAPAECSYVGDVSAKRTADDQEGMGNLRNQAASMGANYVQMHGKSVGTIEGANGTQIPDIMYVGKAYKCPGIGKVS